jgi:hypothetical protein
MNRLEPTQPTQPQTGHRLQVPHLQRPHREARPLLLVPRRNPRRGHQALVVVPRLRLAAGDAQRGRAHEAVPKVRLQWLVGARVCSRRLQCVLPPCNRPFALPAVAFPNAATRPQPTPTDPNRQPPTESPQVPRPRRRVHPRDGVCCAEGGPRQRRRAARRRGGQGGVHGARRGARLRALVVPLTIALLGLLAVALFQCNRRGCSGWKTHERNLLVTADLAKRKCTNSQAGPCSAKW